MVSSSEIVEKGKSLADTFYTTKSWCDALDYTGVWRLGRIKKLDGTNNST
jgi:hypothetical protein